MNERLDRIILVKYSFALQCALIFHLNLFLMDFIWLQDLWFPLLEVVMSPQRKLSDMTSDHFLGNYFNKHLVVVCCVG